MTAPGLPDTDENYLKLERPKVKLPFKVSKTNCNNYAVVDEDDEIRYLNESFAAAVEFATALNNAFKMGADTILHSLATFAVDMRRKHGIVTL